MLPAVHSVQQKYGPTCCVFGIQQRQAEAVYCRQLASLPHFWVCSTLSSCSMRCRLLVAVVISGHSRRAPHQDASPDSGGSMIAACAGKAPDRSPTAILPAAPVWVPWARPHMRTSRSCTRRSWVAGETSPSRMRPSSQRFRAPLSREVAMRASKRLPDSSSHLSNSRCLSLRLRCRLLTKAPAGGSHNDGYTAHPCSIGPNTYPCCVIPHVHPQHYQEC